MFYDLPPAAAIVEISHSCPNSDSERDCFPADRVGVFFGGEFIEFVVKSRSEDDRGSGRLS